MPLPIAYLRMFVVLFVVVLFLFGVLIAQHGIDAAEQYGECRENDRYGRQITLRKLPERLFRQVGGEAKLFDRYAGDVQPGRAAHFAFTVNMVDVLAGIVRDPLLRQLQEVVSLPEGNSAARARLGARRQFPLLDPPMTEDALDDPRVEGACVIIGRDVERAGDDAIPAAEAEVLVVDDRPFRRLGVGDRKS